MSKLLIISILLFSTQIFSQEKLSLQLSGGLISPVNSQSGPSFQVLADYEFSNSLSFFISSGYSYWKKNNVNYKMKIPNDDGNEFNPYRFEDKTSFNKQDFMLIPILAGIKIYGGENRFFKGFLLLDAGLNILRYSDKELAEVQLPDGSIDLSNKNSRAKPKTLTPYSASLGIGLMRQLSDYGNISITYKMSFSNYDNDDSFISRFYSAFYVGYDFKI